MKQDCTHTQSLFTFQFVYTHMLKRNPPIGPEWHLGGVFGVTIWS